MLEALGPQLGLRSPRTELTLDDIDGKSFFFRLATQVTRLFAPVL